MRMNLVPVHSRDYIDSEYAPHVGCDRIGAEFIGNKQIHSLTHSQTYRHSTLYVRIERCTSDTCVFVAYDCLWQSMFYMHFNRIIQWFLA